MRVDPKQIIFTLKVNNDQVRRTARQLGISPGTVINWRRRASTGSLARRTRYSTKGLRRASTAPKSSQRGTTLSASVQDRVVALRRNRGQCAIKIAADLGLTCHPRTVHRLLLSKGLIAARRRSRRPRFQGTTHMHARNATSPGKLQMDVKYVTPELSGLVHTCYLYAVMDIWSRYKQGVILPLLDQQMAIEALKYISSQLPFRVDFIQTDNGLEFQSSFGKYVASLGWQHHYIHKSAPNENAVIERSFRTDEEEFFFRLTEAPVDLLELNAAYQQYLKYYNEERRHLGIGIISPLKKLESVQ